MIHMYDTAYGKIYINLKYNNTIVRMSGGFDSSVMLYAIANAAKILNKDSEFTIHPISVIRIGNHKNVDDLDKENNESRVNDIINFTRNAFPNIKINDTKIKKVTEWWQDNAYVAAQANLVKSIANEIEMEHTHQLRFYQEYNGVTKNPDIIVGNEGINPELHRQKIDSRYQVSGTISSFEEEYYRIEPFRNFDKRAVFSLADRLNILDDMLRMTRSCEGRQIDTDNFTKECQVCWWCCEKEWAKMNYEK